MTKGNVLVVDDEYGIRTGIQEILALEGYNVEVAETGQDALGMMEKSAFDVILIDYRLPDIDGLTLLEAIRARQPKVMTCMITAYANIDTAIAATRRGIDLFLPKPFSPEDLIGVVETLFDKQRFRQEAEQLRLAHEASLLALATEKSQTHSLVERLRDAIMVVNRAGEVVLVNRAMTTLLGSNEADLLRQPAELVLHTGSFAPIGQALRDLSTDRAVFDLEIEDHQYMVSIVLFHAASGETLGQIVTISDISEIRRLAMEKSRFIRTMVHEIRSPLGAIKSIIDVFLDKSLGEKLESYFPLMTRADKRLDGLVYLIGELLSLSRLEMEGIKRPSQGIDVLPFLEEIAEFHKEMTGTKGLKLNMSIEGGFADVVVNPDDFKTIFTNLVSNAIKYNREGGTVSLRVSRQETMARFELSDTGVGIKAENLSRIFEEFFREKRPETRDLHGNGLGLAIVKRLVERNSGRIEVFSTEGVGSTFLIYLPVMTQQQ